MASTCLKLSEILFSGKNVAETLGSSRRKTSLLLLLDIRATWNVISKLREISDEICANMLPCLLILEYRGDLLNDLLSGR